MRYWLDVLRVRSTLTRPDGRPGAALGTAGPLTLAVAAAIFLLGGLWLQTHREVTLVVDGEVSTVQTHAGTVAELLDRVGVPIGPDDRLEPAAGSALVDGMRVEVVHAREVTLLVGEEARQVSVTGLTVEEVLAELGAHAPAVQVGRRDLVRPSRMSRVSSGMVVELSDPLGLSVVADGERREVITDEATVGALLDGLGIEVGPHDRVIPGTEHPVEAGIVVTVRRVEVRREEREQAVPFPTEERRTAALERGQRREVQAGVEGLLRIFEQVTVVDGVEESRHRVGEELVAAPTARIVEVGTAPPPEPEPAGASQPARAADAVNTEEGKASWYDNPYGGYTAAHKTIPRGTIVTVHNVENGRSVQVRINDSGPYVEGRIIDLNRKAFAELAPTWKGVIRVRIEW